MLSFFQTGSAGGAGDSGRGGAIRIIGGGGIEVTGSILVNGGRGGIAQSTRGAANGNGNGGAGGLGRIRLASPSMTNYGVATPALPARLDGTANGSGLTWTDSVADSLNLP